METIAINVYPPTNNTKQQHKYAVINGRINQNKKETHTQKTDNEETHPT